jgi:hypothetical protein
VSAGPNTNEVRIVPNFELSPTRRSREIFDGEATGNPTQLFVYRITVLQCDNAELKIIRDDAGQKLLAARRAIVSLDVSVRQHLYLELVGKGSIKGQYEFLGCTA